MKNLCKYHIGPWPLNYFKKKLALFLVHLMSQKSLEMVLNEQDMTYGSEGGECKV